ncbi:Type 1 glutamine amidotransferase-like domain-containing protein [Chungangia koreensis]|uniref:Type 1 glutamine amidotransferase-like domain-containing protein n=1 Tax=Chungangia koreensis TaxID=752657 RepID=A0ABV8X4A7_9LACT
MGGIILTSTGFLTDEIRTAFLKTAGAFSSAAIITSASPEKEHNRFARKAHYDLLELGATSVTFLDVEFDDPSCLSDCDVIYINGGNPFRLLHHLRKSGAERLLKEAEPHQSIVGVSAGSIVLGPSLGIVQHFTPEMNTIPLHDLTGLNMTKTTVFPHYDREDLYRHPTGDSIEKRITQYERISDFQVHRLKDCEYLLQDHTRNTQK